MSKIEKEKKYIDDNGEYLLTPKEVIIMTPELEKELAAAIELVQECGYYLSDGNEGKDHSMEYTSRNHAIFYLFFAALQILVGAFLVYAGLYNVVYLIMAVVLLVLFGVYRIIKSH